MYFARTPYITALLYPSLTWRIGGTEKTIYLSFDDGPDPAVTPEVLQLLDQYNARATFFCVGEKVKTNPGLYQAILDAGHSTGNHTYNHLNGKKTPTKEFLSNTAKAARYINSGLFRPPYGKFKYKQIKALANTYQIVMWSVLPGDFDTRIPKEKVLKRALKHTTKGSIVVLHDNARFKDKMLFTLEGIMNHFSSRGYTFRAIPPISARNNQHHQNL